MKLKFLLFGILFMFAGFTGFAQEQFTVKSKVLDDRKAPLPGVSVLEVGTQNGTITDFNGNFVKKLPLKLPSFVSGFWGINPLNLRQTNLEPGYL